MKQRMGSSWETLQTQVHDVLSAVIARAKNPPERVARHWEHTTQLTWFGASADHALLHVSWSFGKLRGAAGPGLHTVGVFQVTKTIFGDVDEAKLRGALEAVIPPGTDGATKVFLMRVAAQLATGDALLRLAPAPALTLFTRPDGLEAQAPTPRWPEHARDRVTRALSKLDAPLAKRIGALFDSPQATLLAALRS